MTSDKSALLATPLIATIFGALERDCTVAIEHPFQGDDLWVPYRVVRSGTTAATNLMLVDDIVVDDALKAAGGGRHADD